MAVEVELWLRAIEEKIQKLVKSSGRKGIRELRDFLALSIMVQLQQGAVVIVRKGL